ncbi:MAG: cytochrome c [Actinomycetota bacterium]|nr:cytochrome c [Actinomycetota bacterium]
MAPHRPRARLLPALVAALAAGLLAAGCETTDESATEEAATPARSTPETPSPDQPQSAGEDRGMQLFVAKCGSCHSLDAAGTQGAIGPSLDNIPLTEAGVLKAIRIGGGPHGRGAGERSGSMPRNIVTGQDAEDVAAFVAGSAPGGSAPE